jgi:hypothetical protein
VLYPNPLREDGPVHLEIPFDQPHDYVNVRVFTTAFRKIYENNSSFVPAGVFELDMEPGHFKGSSAANGFYYVLIDIPGHRWIAKLLILR